MCSTAENIITPQLTEARENEGIVLTCQFGATKRLVWRGPGTESSVQTLDNKLLIRKLSKKNEGWYYCLTNSEENITWNFVFFKGPPVFIVPKKALLRSYAYIKVIG